MSDKQAAVEEVIAWYAPSLGLGHWRIEATAMEKHDSEADAWYHHRYPYGIVRVRTGGSPPDDPWRHDDIEENAVHELVHFALRDVSAFVERDLIPRIEGRERKAARARYEDVLERATETFALALKATAHARRDGPAPVIGGLVPSPKGETDAGKQDEEYRQESTPGLRETPRQGDAQGGRGSDREQGKDEGRAHEDGEEGRPQPQEGLLSTTGVPLEGTWATP